MKKIFLVFFLAGCQGITPDWHHDSIATSSRLTTANPFSPLHIEFLSTPTGLKGFAYLTQHHFDSSKPEVEMQITINDETFFEQIPVLEGRMRLRLSDSLTHKLIETLREGQKIDILVDGFSEILKPDVLFLKWEK